MAQLSPKIKFEYGKVARMKRWVFLMLPNRISVFLFRKFLDNNRQRNSLEAAKFVHEINTIYNTKLYFLIPKFLFFALLLGCPAIPSSYQRFLGESIVECRKFPKKRLIISKNVVEQTKKLEKIDLNSHSWKFVSLTLAGFGFIKASAIARDFVKLAAKSEIVLGSPTTKTLAIAVSALLEDQNHSEAANLISKHQSVDPSKALDSHQAYLELVYPSFKSKAKKELPPADRGEAIFNELICDKVVALVAPGQISTKSGREIDSRDTVARIKFYGRASMHDSTFGGTRCDITSHNSDILIAASKGDMSANRVFQEAPDLKLIVSKKKGFENSLGLPVKVMTSWAPTLLTTATSGTLLLFEILKAKPKKIFMCGFDFYTNPLGYNPELLTIYRDGSAPGLQNGELMWKGKSLSRCSLARNHLSHNLKSDFLLVKNLYELSGLIDGTPEVLEILNLTADEYDARLEEMLGDW